MKTTFQQFNQQMQHRQRDMGGYAWNDERQRQAEKDGRNFSKYPKKKSSGYDNIIWILTVSLIIYFLIFSH